MPPLVLDVRFFQIFNKNQVVSLYILKKVHDAYFQDLYFSLSKLY